MERLTGIQGSMFSGKTTELMRFVERAEIAGQKVQVFKPSVDDRWGVETVRSHAGHEHEAHIVRDAQEILTLLEKDTDAVAIDEAQFFDEGIVRVVDEILAMDIKVYFAGLPTDFRHEPFGSMPTLISKADEVIPLTAICTHSDNGKICGEDATRTQRFVNGQPAKYTDPIVLIGAEESYAPRCPNHHIVLYDSSDNS